MFARKELNRDDATGGSTVILRSAPREGVVAAAQVHDDDEEFLCLDGRFTFDGMTWMGPGSYGFYPAKVVHGTRVSVPGGYVLYLRTSGPATLINVPEPRTDVPYSLDGGPGAIECPDPDAGMWRQGADGLKMCELRGASEVTVTLTRAPPGWHGMLGGAADGLAREILLVSGTLETPSGAISAPAYGCYAGNAPRPEVRAASAVQLLVHAGAL